MTDDTVTISRDAIDEKTESSNVRSANLHLQDVLQNIGAKGLTHHHKDLAYYESFTLGDNPKRLLIAYNKQTRQMCITLDDFGAGQTEQLFMGSVGSPAFLEELFKNIGGSL